MAAAGPPGPPGPAALGVGAGEGALRTPLGALRMSRGAGDWPREKTPEGAAGRGKVRKGRRRRSCSPRRPGRGFTWGSPPPRPGVVAELGAPAHTLRGEMLRPRAGGRGGGEVGDSAGSARRRPRSRLPHVSLRLGPPPYTLGVPRPTPRDQTEAPAPPQRPLTAERLTSPCPRWPPPCPPAAGSGWGSGSGVCSRGCRPGR